VNCGTQMVLSSNISCDEGCSYLVQEANMLYLVTQKELQIEGCFFFEGVELQYSQCGMRVMLLC
jgi:hypothetical protein